MKKGILFLGSFIFVAAINAQPTAGMIGYFNFNNSLANPVSAAITATAFSAPFTTNKNGTANSAIQFGGTTASYVNFTDNGDIDFTGSNNFTISFSFYFNGTATGGLIDNCLNYGGWGIFLWQPTPGIWNIQFNYKYNSVGSSAATAFSLGAWHHVAAVRNNGTISVYIDGVFRLSAAEGTTSPTYPINMIAGAMAYSGYSPPRYNPFNGKMDEIRIYNRELSAAEILSLSSFALPLKLISFSGRHINNDDLLTWKTTNEFNTQSFDIERSTDGRNYTSVGNVAAFNTAGDHQYNFTDNNISSLAVPVVYYRLKQKDIDGAFTYSSIVVISINDNKNIVLFYPNPVTTEANVTITIKKAEQVQGKIINNAGRVVKQMRWNLNAGSTALQVDVKGLASGIYWLELKGETINERKQFMK